MKPFKYRKYYLKFLHVSILFKMLYSKKWRSCYSQRKSHIEKMYLKEVLYKSVQYLCCACPSIFCIYFSVANIAYNRYLWKIYFTLYAWPVVCIICMIRMTGIPFSWYTGDSLYFWINTFLNCYLKCMPSKKSIWVNEIQ